MREMREGKRGDDSGVILEGSHDLYQLKQIGSKAKKKKGGKEGSALLLNAREKKEGERRSD